MRGPRVLKVLDHMWKKGGLNNIRRGSEQWVWAKMLVPDQAQRATGEKLGQNWGKSPIFTPESPQKQPRYPPGQKWGRVGVCDSVAAICHTTRTPRVHPDKFLFKPTPMADHRQLLRLRAASAASSTVVLSKISWFVRDVQNGASYRLECPIELLISCSFLYTQEFEIYEILFLRRQLRLRR